MARFYPLRVSSIERDTRESVAVTLTPRASDREIFRYIEGQYLNFRRIFDGEEVRRCYSICSGRDEGVLKVGIKRVLGGCFSSWANGSMKVGDIVEAMCPTGNFHMPLDSGASRYYLGIAGGSGITPILGLIKTVLMREKGSQFTLIYGNRSLNSVMFREELEDIKNEYLSRFKVVHILESEVQDIGLFSGRLDLERFRGLFGEWIDISGLWVAYLCGPGPMMEGASCALREHGVSSDRIKKELFGAGQIGRVRGEEILSEGFEEVSSSKVRVIFDGLTREIEMPRAGMTILNGLLKGGLEVPYSCKEGVCSTCRAKVISGEVEMEANHSLEDYEVRDGYVLTCQSYPLSSEVTVNYDE